MKKQLITLMVLVGFMGSLQAAGDANAGKDKAMMCTACHGTDGNSLAPMWPKLSGQHASFMVKQLVDFKSGARKDDTMNGMAAALSDQDMADIAAFFASNTRSTGTAADAVKAAAGKKIYTAGNSATGVSACMACHGPSGAGNPGAGFPSVNSQYSTYVVKALKDFRSGARTNDAGMMMQSIAKKMSDAEIESVAEYVAGLN